MVQWRRGRRQKVTGGSSMLQELRGGRASSAANIMAPPAPPSAPKPPSSARPHPPPPRPGTGGSSTGSGRGFTVPPPPRAEVSGTGPRASREGLVAGREMGGGGGGGSGSRGSTPDTQAACDVENVGSSTAEALQKSTPTRPPPFAPPNLPPPLSIVQISNPLLHHPLTVSLSLPLSSGVRCEN